MAALSPVDDWLADFADELAASIETTSPGRGDQVDVYKEVQKQGKNDFSEILEPNSMTNNLAQAEFGHRQEIQHMFLPLESDGMDEGPTQTSEVHQAKRPRKDQHMHPEKKGKYTEPGTPHFDSKGKGVGKTTPKN
ncbi:hypothetical protein PGT21_009408 [Puccinia graminis f. sp. tritici]|uniref:Uncharacterized protein n=1 Tax=Puccinia graminis f. sp. tritici TaxID=56615 RepID=A0A5B0PMI4_PUCGR|nr:hypothetical protein PGT21_009408 [Puccinia graminis f. sp. tritici]